VHCFEKESFKDSKRPSRTQAISFPSTHYCPENELSVHSLHNHGMMPLYRKCDGNQTEFIPSSFTHPNVIPAFLSTVEVYYLI